MDSRSVCVCVCVCVCEHVCVCMCVLVHPCRMDWDCEREDIREESQKKAVTSGSRKRTEP